ncbi:GspS/AspS pilotin family protein [Vibrio ruber]|uniref:GspS/AspS pilotin family protein n=1 Tax=Vibrio ruber TaxID=184755 RepID=UPI0028936813|nr:GspS/AspS pilotin family protein [Vibrio ruber]WNJ97120.1 GspS/AspS pilotin family protein [Vibrio ruber]
MRKICIAVGLSAVLIGCSSHSEQKQLELLASNRASILHAELPIKSGPLSIMRASSKGNVIEIMMIYNNDAPKAKSTQSLLAQSIKSYCTNAETLSNLQAGLAYRIKIRNTRGQLMIDQLIDQNACKKYAQKQ